MLITTCFLPFLLIQAVSAQDGILPSFNVDPNGITVSGFSAGAYFATQFHVAFSKLVRGVGIWSGGPPLCGIDEFCVDSPGLIDTENLVARAQELAENGQIDPLQALTNHTVYIFHGAKDEIVNPESSGAVSDFYKRFVSDANVQLRIKTDVPANHAVVSDFFGTACGSLNGYIYVENCHYDSVFHMLDFMYKDLESNPQQEGSDYPSSIASFIILIQSIRDILQSASCSSLASVKSHASLGQSESGKAANERRGVNSRSPTPNKIQQPHRTSQQE